MGHGPLNLTIQSGEGLALPFSTSKIDHILYNSMQRPKRQIHRHRKEISGYQELGEEGEGGGGC